MRNRRIFWKFLYFLAASIGISFLLSVRAMNAPQPEFMGSPPRQNPYATPRSPLDLNYRGTGIEKFWKSLRPTGYYKLWSPSFWATPIVHHFVGWDILEEDVCLRGTIVSMHIADDGDINYFMDLLSEFSRYASPHPKDNPGQKTILVEIPLKMRMSFPAVYDIALGDSLYVCGRYVFDRNHGGWTEIHPPRWICLIRPDEPCVP